MTDSAEVKRDVSECDLISNHGACPLYLPPIGSNGMVHRDPIGITASPHPPSPKAKTIAREAVIPMGTHSVATGTTPAKAEPELSHVAVIDSHSLTRDCIANHVSCLFDDVKVLPFSAIAECNHRKSTDFGLIILYLHASDYQPLELIRSLHAAHSRAIVFLISDLDYQTNPEFIRAAWRLGTRGFVSPKTTSLTLTLSAIRFVQAGGFFAPVDTLLPRSSDWPEPLAAPLPASELTARESVVLSMLKEGKTNKIIARDLMLSSNTVKVHVHNILRKMHVSNRTEAASRHPPGIDLKNGVTFSLS